LASGRHSKQSKGAAARGGSHRAARPEAKSVYTDWVWWPNEPGRRSRADEEFFKLPPVVQAEMLTRIKRLLTGETRYKDVDDLGDGIKELRYRVGNNHYRILFFIAETVCVGLTCFYKNQQRTEKVDLDRAKKRRSSY
jgi:phage-related protein